MAMEDLRWSGASQRAGPSAVSNLGEAGPWMETYTLNNLLLFLIKIMQLPGTAYSRDSLRSSQSFLASIEHHREFLFSVQS